jgi:hypothetical protein
MAASAALSAGRTAWSLSRFAAFLLGDDSSQRKHLHVDAEGVGVDCGGVLGVEISEAVAPGDDVDVVEVLSCDHRRARPPREHSPGRSGGFVEPRIG